MTTCQVIDTIICPNILSSNSMNELAMKRRLVTRHKFKLLVLILGLAFVFLNGIVYQQAYRFTHYVVDVDAIPRLENLSLLEKLKLVVTGLDVPRPTNHRTPDRVGLSCEVHRIPLSPDEHIEGWYIPHADPLGMVLMFPGYAASKDTLLAPATIFHHLGYAIFLADFRGAGGSTGSDTTLGVREAVDVAETVRYTQSRFALNKPVVL